MTTPQEALDALDELHAYAQRVDGQTAADPSLWTWASHNAEMDTHMRNVSAALTSSAAEVSRLTAELKQERSFWERKCVELQVLGWKWAEAHDKLKAGEPYDFPRPADTDGVLAELATARELLAEVATTYAHMEDGNGEPCDIIRRARSLSDRLGEG